MKSEPRSRFRWIEVVERRLQLENVGRTCPIAWAELLVNALGGWGSGARDRLRDGISAARRHAEPSQGGRSVVQDAEWRRVCRRQLESGRSSWASQGPGGSHQEQTGGLERAHRGGGAGHEAQRVPGVVTLSFPRSAWWGA